MSPKLSPQWSNYIHLQETTEHGNNVETYPLLLGACFLYNLSSSADTGGYVMWMNQDFPGLLFSNRNVNPVELSPQGHIALDLYLVELTETS